MGQKTGPLSKVNIHPVNLWFVLSHSLVSQYFHKYVAEQIYYIIGILSHPKRKFTERLDESVRDCVSLLEVGLVILLKFTRDQTFIECSP